MELPLLRVSDMCLAGESMPESEDKDVKAATMFSSVKTDNKCRELQIENTHKLH